MKAVTSQQIVVNATDSNTLCANGSGCPFLVMTKNTIEMANELIIATTSHQASIRHQNQRSRYSSPVPAPIEISTSNAVCADSSCLLSTAATIYRPTVHTRPTFT